MVAGRFKVLVVEDEDLIRGFVRDAVISDPFTEWDVQTVATGEEARDRLRKQRDYDALSLDIHLPGISGIDLIKWMRNENVEVPTVVVSGISDSQTVLDCLRLGAADYVLKPFELRGLRAALRRAASLREEGPGLWRNLELVRPVADWYEVSAPSQKEFAYRFRQFSQALLASRLSAGEIEDLRTAMDELIHNAIEWGNQFDHKRRVKVDFCIFRDRVVTKVEDEGAGFVPEEIDDPSIDPVAHIAKRKETGKRPGGYGMHLVRAVTDEVVYNRRGNAVIFLKYFD